MACELYLLKNGRKKYLGDHLLCPHTEGFNAFIHPLLTLEMLKYLLSWGTYSLTQ